MQGAVARKGIAAIGQRDAQEAVALHGDVKWPVGALEAALRHRAAGEHCGATGSRLHSRAACEASLVVHEVAEPDPDVLVAGGVRVGEVVGEGIEPLPLCGHTSGGGVESLQHVQLFSACAGRYLSGKRRRWTKGTSPGRCLERAKAVGRLVERRVDRRQHALTGLEGTH